MILTAPSRRLYLFSDMRSRFAPFVALALAASALSAQPTRPFGTLREQADLQQRGSSSA